MKSEELRGYWGKNDRVVYGLLSDIAFATKIAQAAKNCHLLAHNFDRAESLLEHLRQKAPILVILDFDKREAEAFKILNQLALDAELKRVPTVGYVSQSKAPVKEEAQRAGCHRVYPKSQFARELDNILMRYAL